MKSSSSSVVVASSSKSSSSAVVVASSSKSSSSIASSSVKSSSVKSSSSSSVVSSSSVASSSAASSLAAHHSGENCMSCHAAGQSAASKTFSFAGTIYKADGVTFQPNAVVKLMNANFSMEIRNMKTDANGNFYSLEPLSSVAITDLHPVVSVDNREISMGNNMLISGSCNLCHTPANPLGKNRLRID